MFRQSFACFLLLAATLAHGEEYRPLELAEQSQAQTVDLSVEDSKRGRIIPIRVYLPEMDEAAPLLLFSHGLGGSREGCSYLGEHWSRHGYAVVFLQHPGSDESVWRDVPVGQRMRAMEAAASGKNFLLRVRDIPAVLDQLEIWNNSEDHVLAKRLDMDKVGMSGHSFGAVSTQAVSGQGFGSGRKLFTDERIVAALVMSPSSPKRGDPQVAFGKVSIPWMLMTGTRDTSPIGKADMASRLAVFPALPPGDKYELLLYGAEHSAFSERPLPGDSGPRNPRHHRAILALSTAFWDAYIRGNHAAGKWLKGKGAESVLDDRDRWQVK